MPPIYRDNDFWWLRYFCGIALPIFFGIVGLCSVVSRHSYAVWVMRYNIRFVPVTGEQAVLWGIAYLGIALALFANCYLQYDEKGAYYYQWPLTLGMIAAAGGILWYGWIILLA